MKRIILIAALFLFCVSSNAQLTRTVYKCTLGVHSKQQVKSAMLQQGFKVIKETSDEISFEGSDLIFGGIHWERLTFYFYKGLLKNIIFLNHTFLKIADADYENIHASLKEKYGSYYKKYGGDELTVKTCDYKDSRTLISLSYKHIYRESTSYYLILSYSDINLSMQMMNASEL